MAFGLCHCIVLLASNSGETGFLYAIVHCSNVLQVSLLEPLCMSCAQIYSMQSIPEISEVARQAVILWVDTDRFVEAATGDLARWHAVFIAHSC